MSAGLLFDATQLHRLRGVRGGVQGGEPPAAADRADHHRLHLDDGGAARAAAERAPRCACTAWSPTCVSVCPVGALQQDAGGAGRLRRRQVHRLPLLHHGLPVRRAEVPVGPRRPGGRQVRDVRRARREGPADRVRRACARPARRCSASATRCSREARARIARQPRPATWTTSTALDEAGGTSVLMLVERAVRAARAARPTCRASRCRC